MDPNENTPDPLDEKLKTWEVVSPLPPRFQQNVWNQIIAHEKPKALPSFWHRVESWLAPAFLRPPVASAYLAALLAVGIATGYRQARDKTSQWESQLATRYVQSVDPYQLPRP